MDAIMALAAEHGLIVIEDAAQAPGARQGERYAGTLGHIGVFSLNYHKHIHCGEGAVVVTNDPALAEKLRLIRNHSEVVLQQKPGGGDLNNMIGFNYRMTEIEAAIASEQLKKLDRLLAPRIERANQLTDLLSNIGGISTPVVKPSCVHAYYIYALRYDAETVGVPRAQFAAALKAEGIPISEGYVAPIYLQPLYQQKRLFGGTGSPWTEHPAEVSYERGLCPVTERMHFEDLIYTGAIHGQLGEADLADIAEGFRKVSDHYHSAGA
jgi:dTDP-4-amino-4,6-dideoxygalactose transaminase